MKSRTLLNLALACSVLLSAPPALADTLSWSKLPSLTREQYEPVVSFNAKAKTLNTPSRSFSLSAPLRVYAEIDMGPNEDTVLRRVTDLEKLDYTPSGVLYGPATSAEEDGASTQILILRR